MIRKRWSTHNFQRSVYSVLQNDQRGKFLEDSYYSKDHTPLRSWRESKRHSVQLNAFFATTMKEEGKGTLWKEKEMSSFRSRCTASNRHGESIGSLTEKESDQQIIGVSTQCWPLYVLSTLSHATECHNWVEQRRAVLYSSTYYFARAKIIKRLIFVVI